MGTNDTEDKRSTDVIRDYEKIIDVLSSVVCFIKSVQASHKELTFSEDKLKEIETLRDQYKIALEYEKDNKKDNSQD